MRKRKAQNHRRSPNGSPPSSKLSEPRVPQQYEARGANRVTIPNINLPKGRKN